jgi:UDP-3-O-[3-hydroxymyristoyl] glucosamine N-acyltransferase LpxD
MNVSLHQLCNFLQHDCNHEDFLIKKAVSINSPDRFSIIFVRRITSSQTEKLLKFSPICLLVEDFQQEIEGIVQIKVNNPRLTFIQIVNKFLIPEIIKKISFTAIIHETAQVGNNVLIGDYTIIGANSLIEDDCEIMSHVVIGENVRCGQGTRIKSGSIIGQKGFGFERDEDGIPIEFPHIGGVFIGENCEIGALNTIVSGTLDPTYIGNHVKTDDHVHIAHNVSIGSKTLIAACAEISGSVAIGSRVWISPNATIINKISIGDQAFIGIGAVVTKSVPERCLFAGNPAKFIREVKPGKDPV